MSITQSLTSRIDETTAGRRFVAAIAATRARRVHLHWTNLLGVVTVASLAVLFVTGVMLMFVYTPSSERVVYDGGYLPLDGVEMSKAYESTLALSFDVRGGLLIRQAHHWAALLLPASIILQLLATFFTGAFRRPRQLVWVLLFLILIAALAAGWSGYALPDDMLSGTGLVIVQGIVLGVPVIGSWVSALLFGGSFPGRIIENLFPLHLIVSVLLVGLVIAKIRSALAHGPQHFRGRADRIVPLPIAATRAVVLFGAVCGMLVLMSATVQVAPIWVYGPADPGNASAGSQPDWYTGFLDGALRLVPPGWEVQLGGFTLTLAVLVPLALVSAYLGAVLLYPFLENWLTQGKADADILDSPRDVPARTAIGVAGMAVYGVLWGAASADILATQFRLSLESVVIAFQILLFVGPTAAFWITRGVCVALQRRDADVRAHGYETGRIVRLPGGGYVEVHGEIAAPPTEDLDDGSYLPQPLRPDAAGRITIAARARALLSRQLFRDASTEPRARARLVPQEDSAPSVSR